MLSNHETHQTEDIEDKKNISRMNGRSEKEIKNNKNSGVIYKLSLLVFMSK